MYFQPIHFDGRMRRMRQFIDSVYRVQTYKEIGDEYGFTKQRTKQIMKTLGITAPKDILASYKIKALMTLEKEMTATCAVCGKKFLKTLRRRFGGRKRGRHLCHKHYKEKYPREMYYPYLKEWREKHPIRAKLQSKKDYRNSKLKVIEKYERNSSKVD